MSIIEDVEYLSDKCDGCLSIIHYTDWELHSYKKGTLFFDYKDSLREKTFEKLIERAMKKVKKMEKTSFHSSGNYPKEEVFGELMEKVEKIEKIITRKAKKQREKENANK